MLWTFKNFTIFAFVIIWEIEIIQNWKDNIFTSHFAIQNDIQQEMVYPREGALYYLGFDNQKCKEDRSCTLTTSSYATKRRPDERSNAQAPDNGWAI